MKKDYSNLKQKTFLYFTDDKNVILKILNEKEIKSFPESASEMGKYITFLEFAKITGDKDLEIAVLEQFQDIFNE